jgi:spore coat protein A, manganese oxidase
METVRSDEAPSRLAIRNLQHRKEDDMTLGSKRFGLTVTLALALVGALATISFARDGCPDRQAPAFPGSTTCVLDPTSIPKYVIPLVIPPVMSDKKPSNAAQDKYEIAVRQFKQQILPGGIWNVLGLTTENFPATTVWSYGPAADPEPDASGIPGIPAGVAPAPNSQFNYPAYTFETKSNKRVKVRWINDLKENFGAGPNFLPHLLPIDQTLHWANPSQDCHMDPDKKRTDCMGHNPEPYRGPVPIVTHVHGSHVDPHSDGYPEAWWLPAANNIPDGYATSGSFFDDATGANPGNLGYADYSYRNNQPATTLWYHDHALGMTRSNVYAGPAGFWLVRGGEFDKVDNVHTKFKGDGILPGPAPKAGDTVLELNAPGVLGAKDVRSHIREIPIAIQDRSFTPKGQLFYPANRAFFEGVNPDELQIPFIGDPAQQSDVSPIWNPEAFFNSIVVNGTTWPKLEVAPALYRLRLLNGCNSRFLNLSLKIISSPIKHLVGQEVSFYQIGAEQGFLPKVVEIRTGFATPLRGDGRIPSSADRVAAPDPDQALLMALAERADVLIDFRLLPPGTVVQMYNTAPDEPFGGFDSLPGEPAVSDPNTTGQVMQFVVNWHLFKVRDIFATSPWALKLNAEPALQPAVVTRNVSLNELESSQVCVFVDQVGEFTVPITQLAGVVPPCPAGTAPFGPTQARQGTVDLSDVLRGPAGIPLQWTDESGASKKVQVTMTNGTTKDVFVTENPNLGDIEEWNIYNFTADAHPIHLHLVRFEVVKRTLFDGTTPSPHGSVQPWETGFKDTVITYPGEITTVKAKFDIPGLYVWHCHIVEHEDNEMMRPYVVSE